MNPWKQPRKPPPCELLMSLFLGNCKDWDDGKLLLDCFGVFLAGEAAGTGRSDF